MQTKFLGDVQTRFKPAKSDPQDVPMTFRVAKAMIERTVPIIDRSSIAALLELIEKDLESEPQDNDASPKGRRGARAKGASKSSLQSCSPEAQKKTKRALQLIEVELTPILFFILVKYYSTFIYLCITLH